MATRTELKDVIAANAGFEKRIELEDAFVSYDAEFDIFLLRFGKPRPATSEEVGDGLQVRVDPKTLEILGFEILGFRRRFLAKNPEFIGLYRLLFEDRPLLKRRLRRGDQRRSGQLRDLLPLDLVAAAAPA